MTYGMCVMLRVSPGPPKCSYARHSPNDRAYRRTIICLPDLIAAEAYKIGRHESPLSSKQVSSIFNG